MELRPHSRPLTRRSLLRSAVAVGAATATGGLLAGCGSNAAPPGVPTVRIWSWLTGMDSYVAAFNAAQDDVFVELSVIASGNAGGYAQQTAALRAHNAPDILQMEYPALPQMLLTGGLRDLTDDVADLEPGFSKAAWDLVRPGGRTWAVPFDLGPMAFFHRRDLFDRYGLRAPRTWTEFRTTAEAVRRAAPESRITTFPLTEGAFLTGMSWGAGDRWWTVDGDSWRVRIDGPGTVRTARYWDSMIDDDLVSTMPTTNNQNWSAAMHDGRLWGMLGAAWNVGTLKKSIPNDKGRWAVAPMPGWDGGPPANGVQGGSTFGISRESTEPEAALRFLRWLSTDPAVPRIGVKLTMPFPAHEPNRAVARAAYPNDYFVGDPIYDVFDVAAERVPQWTWGPNALGVFSTIADEVGGPGSLTDAIGRVQTAAVSDMRGRGLAVVEGSAS